VAAVERVGDNDGQLFGKMGDDGEREGFVSVEVLGKDNRCIRYLEEIIPKRYIEL
jgi:hypothetical protein